MGGATQTVGLQTALCVLLLGPLYYWRKGALTETVVLCLLTFLPLIVPDGTFLIGSDGFSFVVWGVSFLLAPALLAWSYERRGWDEITPR